MSCDKVTFFKGVAGWSTQLHRSAGLHPVSSVLHSSARIWE